MLQLVNAIADLIALRDRQALDQAMVALVKSLAGVHCDGVAIYRRAGEVGDERWLGDGDMAGDDLPALGQFPQRVLAMEQRQIVQTRTDRWTTIFPIAEALEGVGVMEVQSTIALADTLQAQIAALLRMYRNFRSLLDYGERDTLTDLLNRKTFEGSFMKAVVAQDAAADTAQPNRRVKPPAGNQWLGMIDIDHFKRVNDNFGHLIGDEVLLLLARLMRANFRLQDQLYRFGGEEFVVLIQNVSAADAKRIFERLRERTEKNAFPQVGCVTVSVGFSCLRPGDTPDSAFSRSDKAVYYAKAHGRNQVCNFEELAAAGHLVDADTPTGEVELF